MLERIKAQPWMAATVVLAVALVVALVFLFTGTGGDGASSDDEAAVDATSTTASTGDGEEPSTPPPAPGEDPGYLAVIVDNAPAAQPQVGISEAPLLVEYPVEGGLTRFTALVPGASSGLIGPVRSLRPVNAELLPPLTSAVVSTGGQPFVVAEMEGAGVTSVTPDLVPGFISLGRPSPHDVFLQLDELADLFVPDASAPGLPTGSLPAASGPAGEVTLPYDGVTFSYEQGPGYVRHQNGEPYQVLESTGSNEIGLARDLVVILYAAQRPAGYSDTNDVPVSTFDVIGSGDLQVLYGGELYEGRWSRSAAADPFVFSDASGASIGLPEGSVYLAIVPRESDVPID